MSEKLSGSYFRPLFREFQKHTLLPRDARDAAQMAIIEVVAAFHGIVSASKVVSALGDAKTPNAVSRAVRHRLPPIK